MTKQEHIEEMSESVVCSAIVSKAKIDDKVAINLNKFVENMIRIGYRKIDDDCAVITKDELKQYKAQAVKEFADELKAMCSDYLYDTNFDGKNDFDIHISELSRMIDELLKEYEK